MRSRLKNFISDTILLLRSVPSSIVSLFVLSVVLMNLLANKTIYQRGRSEEHTSELQSR